MPTADLDRTLGGAVLLVNRMAATLYRLSTEFHQMVHDVWTEALVSELNQ